MTTDVSTTLEDIVLDFSQDVPNYHLEDFAGWIQQKKDTDYVAFLQPTGAGNISATCLVATFVREQLFPEGDVPTTFGCGYSAANVYDEDQDESVPIALFGNDISKVVLAFDQSGFSPVVPVTKAVARDELARTLDKRIWDIIFTETTNDHAG